MKKLKNLWYRIWQNTDEPRTDNVNHIMAILTENNSIETQISMKLEFDALFDEKLISIREKNSKENKAIDHYFTPFRSKKTEVIDVAFLEPIKN